jgi:hypothetical protein
LEKLTGDRPKISEYSTILEMAVRWAVFQQIIFALISEFHELPAMSTLLLNSE